VEGGCRGGRISWKENIVEGGECRGERMFLTHLILNVVCGPDRYST
jgi:hypothetical protein